MARPRKNDADYFPHDADGRNDEKIRILRKKFGMDGYGVRFMLLEQLTDADHFRLEYPQDDVEWEVRASDFDIDVERLSDIVETMLRIKLIQMSDDGKIYSKKHIDRLQPMLDKRRRSRKNVAVAVRDENGRFCDRNLVSAPVTRVSVTETPITVTETPQSKVKESKVNNSVSISTDGGAKKTTHTPTANHPKKNNPDYRNKMRDVETRGSAYLNKRNEMMGKSDLMNQKIKYGLYNLLQTGIDMQTFSGKINDFVDVCGIIRDHALEKYLYMRVHEYDLGKFLEHINTITGPPAQVIKRIVHRDYEKQVLRRISTKDKQQEQKIEGKKPIDKDAEGVQQFRNAAQKLRTKLGG